MSASAAASAQAGSRAGKGASMIDAGGGGGAARGSRCHSSSVTYGISGCSNLLHTPKLYTHKRITA